MVDDALGKVLGPYRGYVRGFGFGVTHLKLSLLSQQDHKYKTEPSEELSNATVSVLKGLNIPPTCLMSSPINNNSQIKCKLLDWYGSGEIVADGRWSSNDPAALVHHVPIGSHAIRVWVDVAKKSNAYLWRPT
ncbi:Plant transposase [Cucumis melo var. makuwa]|uniref:Plant transposase n=1 Tax=Cucumis melo var. makuwa TaxID=1194695 RepID=A0A5D3E404_CUCMM|nr:Plant transposase [Cucumis melo var. makuwa]TYK30538.1 Plant transposase [Cucumis melo var. makuwa]